jgi:hypothetical protein
VASALEHDDRSEARLANAKDFLQEIALVGRMVAGVRGRGAFKER